MYSPTLWTFSKIPQEARAKRLAAAGEPVSEGAYTKVLVESRSGWVMGLVDW